VRAVLGVLGLVLVLGIVGWLAKTQLASTRQSVSPLAVPGGDAAGAPAATVREQSQQIQQHVKESVEAAMQQARPVPEDK
jgi:hypothetical protein